MRYWRSFLEIVRYFQKQRIRAKLMFALIPSVVLILTITGYITYLVSNNFLKEAIKRTVTLNTLAIAHEIETVLDRAIKDMLLFYRAYIYKEDPIKVHQNCFISNGFPYAEVGIFSNKDKSFKFFAFLNNKEVRSFAPNEIQFIKPNPADVFFKYINLEIFPDLFTEVAEVSYPSLELQLQHSPTQTSLII